MVPLQVLVAHRWMSVLCREGVDALRDHSPAAHAYADWSSLLLCAERLFSGPQGPRALGPSASIRILSDLREDAGCYSNNSSQCCFQDPGLRDWPVKSPKVSKVHKSEVCTARFNNLSDWRSAGAVSVEVGEQPTAFTVSSKFN